MTLYLVEMPMTIPLKKKFKWPQMTYALPVFMFPLFFNPHPFPISCHFSLAQFYLCAFEPKSLHTVHSLLLSLDGFSAIQLLNDKTQTLLSSF